MAWRSDVYRYTVPANPMCHTDGQAIPSRRSDASSGPARTSYTSRGQTSLYRDASTVLAYSALTCFAFWNYAYGPALALLRSELEFSYTLLGVYTAAWSAGPVLTGVVFARTARRQSREALVWGSASLASFGAGVFLLGSGLPSTLVGAGILGFGGTMLLTVLQAVLSDRHGERRGQALTEANIGAAACAVFAPLALSALAVTAVGWRGALALPGLGLAVLYLRYRRQMLPQRPGRDSRLRRGRLPVACWLFAGLAAGSMGVEFCLVYFGAEQLQGTGLSTTAAVTAMSSQYVGLLIGRIGGALATRSPGRTVPLLYLSLAATTGGFLLFWLSAVPAIAVLGLLLAGLGIANLYPLSLALSLDAAPGQEDQANSRSQLLGGLTVMGAPYLLGNLADHLGLSAAFAIEPVLIGLCLVLLVTGLRARQRAN